MVVYRLSERSRDSGPQLNQSSAGPRVRCFGAHGQFPMIAGIALIFAMAAFSIPLSKMPAQNVTRIIAGDNIMISPDNGYGDVTIDSTGVGGNGILENNVTRIIAGENIIISPENGYDNVTITAIIENVGYVGTKEVDETDIDDSKILEYFEEEGKLGYVPKPAPRTLTIYEARSTSTERLTSMTTWVDHPDFHLTQYFSDCMAIVLVQILGARSVDGGVGYFELLVDGVPCGISAVNTATAGSYSIANMVRNFDISAGTHTFKIIWKVGDALGGTLVTPGWANDLGLSILIIA